MLFLTIWRQELNGSKSVSSMAVVVLVRQGDDGCAVTHAD